MDQTNIKTPWRWPTYNAINPHQLKRRFRTERDCLRYLIKRKWPEGFRCPRCGHNEAYVIEKRRLYQCKRCRPSDIAYRQYHISQDQKALEGLVLGHLFGGYTHNGIFCPSDSKRLGTELSYRMELVPQDPKGHAGQGHQLHPQGDCGTG